MEVSRSRGGPSADTDGDGRVMTRVLVVDDHSFFRLTLTGLLDATDDLEVVGECSDGTEVVAAVAALRPDVVLMDVRMKELSGIEAAQLLQDQGASARVLMLSSDATPSTRAAARRSGAVGFLTKGNSPHEVLEAVREAARGRDLWREEDR